MKIIAKKNWEYILYEKDNKIIFSVICGTSAQFDVEIEFNSIEKKEFDLKGDDYLKDLAEKIRSNPLKWESRKIN